MPQEAFDPEELSRVLRSIAERYGPLITFEEAAQIARRSIATVYTWSSMGHFDRFVTRRGSRRLLGRDAFVAWLFESDS